jgi:serralysin
MVWRSELGDAAAGRTTAYAMGLGDVFAGRLTASDRDWLRIDLVAGQVVTFGAVGLGGLGVALADPTLVLHSASGAVLASNTNGGPGFLPSLTWTVATSGSYYIDIRAADGAAGSYGLTAVLGDMLSLGADLGAGVLQREGLSWSSQAAMGTELTWAFRASGPAADSGGTWAPFSRLSAPLQAAATAALGAYSDLTDLHFTRIAPSGYSNSATILFGGYTSATDAAGAYAYYPGTTASSDASGDVWLNLDAVSAADLTPGSYGWYVLLHELGHAMGLSHPGDYNAGGGTITYATSAQFREDSGQYTVMSYFDATETTAAPAIYAQTLMMYDIRALQGMYGVNEATRAGATVYGFNSTLAGSVYDFSSNKTPLLCIWDGGGTDEINLSGFGGKQRLDLRAGSFSDVGGFAANLSIALDCVIENGTGGRGADGIIGNVAANRLKGLGGADTLSGGAGADTLIGGAGADVFVLQAGDGVDRVSDFSLVEDRLQLASSLWGGVVKTAADVVAGYGGLRNGHVVFDFGPDEIHLMTLSALSGIESRLDLV